MYESISKNHELENEMTLDMSYFWYSDNTLAEFYFLDTLTSKTGLHVVFAGLSRPVQDIVGRICCICPFQI